MKARIAAAFVLTLLSDGWSGHQKEHVLNVLLATPDPFFIENIYTKADRVDGSYQADIFEALCRTHPKVKAVCTDNASVMRLAWRLLRDRLPKLWTYGCACHGFNLHAKDICKLEGFAATVSDCGSIATYFSRNLQLGGLATLRIKQVQVYGKQKAIKKAGATRWNSQVDCAQSIVDSKDALMMTATEADFISKENSADVGALIRDVEFWRRVQVFIDTMEPVRRALKMLQSDRATPADVYAQWIEVHREHAGNATLVDILEKRMDFLIHPLHFVSYAFHPRYCHLGFPRAVAMHWMRRLAEDVDEVNADKLESEMMWFFGTFMSAPIYKPAFEVNAVTDMVRASHAACAAAASA